MTTAEIEIMLYFRQYDVGIGQMLFFYSGLAKSHPPKFHQAMASLMRNGLVIEERYRAAYSLTPRGFQASRTAGQAQTT